MASGHAAAEECGSVEVHPGGDDDLHPRALGDLADEGDVAAEVERREVDQRADALVVGLLELLECPGDLGVAVEGVRPVDPRTECAPLMMWLVWEREPQVGGVDGAPDGFDGGHAVLLS